MHDGVLHEAALRHHPSLRWRSVQQKQSYQCVDLVSGERAENGFEDVCMTSDCNQSYVYLC